MSNDEDWRAGKTQQGVAVGRARKRDRAFDDTLPGTQRLAIPQVPASPDDNDIVTSAPVSTLAATAQTSGSVSLSGDRVSEALARELIVRRMSKSGIHLQEDYAFSRDELLVRLDGYDPHTCVGYQFISHAGDDVVTDFDAAAEARLAQLSAQGIVHVLVIHDHRAQDTTEVLKLVEAFLDNLTF